MRLKLPSIPELEEPSSNRNISMAESKTFKSSRRVSESLLQSTNKETFNGSSYDNDWLTHEIMNLEQPAIKKMSEELQLILRNNENFVFSHSCDFIAKISEEIVRMSRDEPGGVATCRVQLNLVNRDKSSATGVAEELGTSLQLVSTNLGSSLVSGGHVVETSRIDVYLLSSSSILSRLQSIVRSFSSRGLQKDCKHQARPQKISLLPECVLLKQKLFRSSNKKSICLLKLLENQ